MSLNPETAIKSEKLRHSIMVVMTQTLASQGMIQCPPSAYGLDATASTLVSGSASVSQAAMEILNLKFHEVVGHMCDKALNSYRVPKDHETNAEAELVFYAFTWIKLMFHGGYLTWTAKSLGMPDVDLVHCNDEQRRILLGKIDAHLLWIVYAAVRLILRGYDGTSDHYTPSEKIIPTSNMTQSEFDEMDQRSVAEIENPGSGTKDLVYKGKIISSIN